MGMRVIHGTKLLQEEQAIADTNDTDQSMIDEFSQQITVYLHDSLLPTTFLQVQTSCGGMCHNVAQSASCQRDI